MSAVPHLAEGTSKQLLILQRIHGSRPRNPTGVEAVPTTKGINSLAQKHPYKPLCGKPFWNLVLSQNLAHRNPTLHRGVDTGLAVVSRPN